MAKVLFILALVIQATIIFANDVEEENEITSREILKNKPDVEEEFTEIKPNKEWMDMFFMPLPNNLHPISSASALMSSITDSDKSAEEQLEDIKEMANKITLAVQSELANLLAYALANVDKDKDCENDENKLRRKRETPMDSSQLIMRLLKHIKNNNEYQNIAIDKMMTAQEIADKYGIDFAPDTDVLSDMAIAANEQAKEMTTILKDACHMNTTHIPKEEVEFVPFEQSPIENDTYYVYSLNHPEEEMFMQQPFPVYEHTPEHYPHSPAVNHGHQDHYYDHLQYGHQSMPHHVPAPVQQNYIPHQIPPPVTPKPTFYDSMMGYVPDFYPYCPVEPVTTTTTIVLPIEEFVEPEPELVGEEYEETVSSKLFVTRDEEPGSATVNHVTTYTVSEKAHFKKPEIERLPQQMQYTFFLM
ncbi:hypothetical protein NE865_15082 [Phthorimaea operculella]|nr:hypothetical protein NE865_15082 [Phthorimaea operculella]